jgi:hypothetical protein
MSLNSSFGIDRVWIAVMTAPARRLLHTRRPSKLATAVPEPGDDAHAAGAVLKSQLIQMDARFRDAMARAAGCGPSPPSAIQRRV